MSVKLPVYATRGDTLKLLEGPVRALLTARPTSEAWDDLRTIIAELDAIDAVTAAAERDKARAVELREAIRAELVTPAAAGARCTDTTKGYRRNTAGVNERVIITHAAKVMLNGQPWCLTHVRTKADNAVRHELYRRDDARRAAGELTDDERLIEARRAAVRGRQ